MDGFEIKRKGEVNVPARIIIQLLNNPEKFRVSPEMGALLGIHTETKSDIIAAIWKYIKANHLQDSDNKTLINNDEAFIRLFGVKQMPIQAIANYILRHLTPPESLDVSFVVEYAPLLAPPPKKMTTHSSFLSVRSVSQFIHSSPVVYDVDVDVDEDRMSLDSFLNSNTSHKDLLELEQKVMNTIHQINTAKRKREFLLEFVEDPVDFINNWIESQSGDLRELLGERAVEAEEIRKAEFFDQPWVNEAVFHYLNVKRQEPVDQFYSKMKPK